MSNPTPEQIKAAIPNTIKVLPKVWTHAENFEILKICWNLKIDGIDWKSNDQFGLIMANLTAMGVLEQDGTHVFRLNPIYH